MEYSFGSGRRICDVLDTWVDVSEMVAQDIAHPEAKQLYSLLSSVAHGHRAEINAFITTSPDSDVLGMAARIPVVTELAMQVHR